MSPDPGAAVGVMIVDDQAPFRRAARMVMAANSLAIAFSNDPTTQLKHFFL